uniref:Uncharacterized protein n=1 Tax=Arundo donax TaxID=35708 RepID=A0A0A8Z226_ARUDO
MSLCSYYFASEQLQNKTFASYQALYMYYSKRLQILELVLTR